MYRFVNSSTGTYPPCVRLHDYGVVFERNESIRSMKLPLDLYWYGTDEQAALGAWVLLEANH